MDEKNINIMDEKNINIMDEKNINIMDERITKCLKSYLTGKKKIDTDNEKAFEYFKQCITILDDIKKQNINIKHEYKNILEETEIECSKLLTETIERTFDKSIEKKLNTKYNKITNIEFDKTLFEIIDTGDINKLKSYNMENINLEIFNHQGLTPMHYAIKVGDTTFLKHAFVLGGYIDQTSKLGHTLLEFACLENDPNMILFLQNYGANMKKHMAFREGKKYDNNGNQIDTLLLEKIILENGNNNPIKYLNFIFNYINKDDNLDIKYNGGKFIKTQEFILKLDNFIDTFDNDSRNTYIDILKEELDFELLNKLCCPTNKIEIILYNLIPFINYDNLSYKWLIYLEIKLLIIKLLKKKIKININEFKQELGLILYDNYIKNNIIATGLVQTIVKQLLNKINV